MKTYITEPPAVSQPPPKFPLLARSKATGAILLFDEKNSGMVLLKGNDSSFELGYYCRGWENVFNGHSWQILPPGTKVTLEQEAVS